MGDWTSNPISSDTANWIWTDQPSLGEFRNLTIVSPSAADGWVVFDAEYMTSPDSGIISGPPPYPQHSGELISPIIDCSNFPAVSLKWYQNYAPLNSTSSFSYSIDGGNTWSDDIIVNGNIEANASSPTPSSLRFYMPEFSNQDSVRIKFTFDGAYYEWLIDDVRLIQTEPNNLRIMDNSYAIAPNAQTPASQLEAFSFLADIQNIGSVTQSNVNLSMTITEATRTVDTFTTDLKYGSVTFDSLVENQPFVEYFSPQTDLVTSYTGTYSLFSDSTDFDPRDNSISFSFQATDSTFAKSPSYNRSLAPSDFFWPGGLPLSYSIGNYYYVVNRTNTDGEPLFATSAKVGISNPQDHSGKDLFLWLYKWDDINFDQIAQKGTELTTVGSQIFTLTGNEPLNSEFIIPLSAINDPNSPVPLESNTAYLLVLEYTTDNLNDRLYVLATEDTYDYSAQFLRSELDGPASTRYGHVLSIGDEPYFRMTPTMDNSTTNLGHQITPLIHLNINTQPIVSTTELSPDNIINVFPSPANEVLTIHTALVKVSETVRYQLFDLNGRLVGFQEFNAIRNQQVQFDTKSLTAGTYLLQISTGEGSRTQAVIVQH